MKRPGFSKPAPRDGGNVEKKREPPPLIPIDAVLRAADNRGLATPELLAEVGGVGRHPAELHRMLSQLAMAEPYFMADVDAWVLDIVHQIAKDCRGHRISMHPILACIVSTALRTMSLHGFIVGRASMVRSLDEAFEVAWRGGQAEEPVTPPAARELPREEEGEGESR